MTLFRNRVSADEIKLKRDKTILDSGWALNPRSRVLKRESGGRVQRDRPRGAGGNAGGAPAS